MRWRRAHSLGGILHNGQSIILAPRKSPWHSLNQLLPPPLGKGPASTITRPHVRTKATMGLIRIFARIATNRGNSSRILRPSVILNRDRIVKHIKITARSQPNHLNTGWKTHPKDTIVVQLRILNSLNLM